MQRLGSIPTGEFQHVGYVGPTPLIDCLIVIGDDAEVDGWLSQKTDEPLLSGVDVLVFVHDQVPQRTVNPLEDLGASAGL